MEKKKNIHEGHRERMRNKLSKMDSNDFEPHELLEYILFTVIPRSNTNGIAHELLNAFDNSISEVFDTPVEKLTECKGVGRQTAIFIHSIPILSKFYLRSKYSLQIKITTKNMRELCIARANMLENNGIFIIYLNADGSILDENTVKKDCINDNGLINLRNIAHYFFDINSAAVIMIHKIETDMENININHNIRHNIEMITEMLISFEMPLIDYIIIYKGEFISLRNSGSFDA